MSAATGVVDPPHPERPAEIVELSEHVYQGIFGAGLAVASGMCLLAIALSAAQPPHYRLSGAVSSSALLAFCVALYARRRAAYQLLRNHPWAIVAPALAVGGGSWATGVENQQLFYVVTLVLGVTGMAVPLRYLSAAVTLAALFMAMPKLASNAPGLPSTAMAALTVPTIFWLIIDRLASYMLRANELTRATATVAAEHHSRARRAVRPTRRLTAGPRRRLLTALRTDRAEPAAADLSARQLQIILLCAEGLNHIQIAASLGIGAQQVRRHLRQARNATGSKTSAGLVAWAIRARLVQERPGFH